MLQSALARRLAFVIVAAVLAWFGMGRAHAQQAGCTLESNNYRCQTRAQAYQQAKNVPVSTCSFSAYMCEALVEPLHNAIPQPDTYAGRYVPRWLVNFGNDGKGERSATVDVYYISECPVGTEWSDSLNKCEGPKDCASEPDLPAGSYTAPDTEICSGGCKFAGKGGLCVGVTVDAQQQWYCSAWEPTGAECSVGQGDTPPSPSDADGDGSSDGTDTSPNNPGQGGGGKDGKPQEDGGGKGDGNGPGEGSGNGNTSGGGGNCASPPSSSGDAILAQIAYQTWATRCAIEGAKDANGNLKTTQGGSGPGGGEGEGEGTDFGTSNPGEDEEFDPSTVKRFGIPVNTSMLDSEAIFGGGTCPVLTVTIYGNTFSSTEIQGWCDLLGIMRALVLLFGAFTALRILMGNAT